MAVSYVQVNGHRIRYRVEGSAQAPLVVFGHGLLGSLEQVDEHVPGLRELYEHMRVLVYDARGHGKSEGPEEPAGYTWEALARDMAALVGMVGESKPAVFGGGSMGAATSLWVALEEPERVQALVLAIPPPLGREAIREEDEKRALFVLDFAAAAIENYGLEKTVEMLREMPGFARTPEEAEERARLLRSQNPRTIIAAIRGLLNAPNRAPEEYRQVKAPTLILAHEGDGLHPVRSAKTLAENIPGARLLVGDRPGYWRRHPDELNAELRDFFARIG